MLNYIRKMDSVSNIEDIHVVGILEATITADGKGVVDEFSVETFTTGESK